LVKSSVGSRWTFANILQTGDVLSFTGYLAFCLGRAVDEDKSVQAYPRGRKHMVIFEDVDVFLPVERELGATRAALPYVIRRANHKSCLEIHREIRAFQTQPVQPGTGMPAPFRFMMSAPWPLPRLFVRLIRAVGPARSDTSGFRGARSVSPRWAWPVAVAAGAWRWPDNLSS
jgi:hypothetical protein